MEAKVGQRVRMFDGPVQWAKPLNGDEGTITNVKERYVTVRFDCMPQYELPMRFEEIKVVG